MPVASIAAPGDLEQDPRTVRRRVAVDHVEHVDVERRDRRPLDDRVPGALHAGVDVAQRHDRVAGGGGGRGKEAGRDGGGGEQAESHGGASLVAEPRKGNRTPGVWPESDPSVDSPTGRRAQAADRAAPARSPHPLADALSERRTGRTPQPWMRLGARSCTAALDEPARPGEPPASPRAAPGSGVLRTVGGDIADRPRACAGRRAGLLAVERRGAIRDRIRRFSSRWSRHPLA